MSTCQQCQSPFEVTDEDRKFYEKVSPVFSGQKYLIPEPTFCPDCRQQMRLAWRSELHVFNIKSDFSGKNILSSIPQDAGYKIYSEEEWWSDKKDPLNHGRDFDFSRTFFEQMDELIKASPLLARTVFGNENSDYINNASWCKNCYLLAGANHSEDCYYGNYINDSKSCVDCNFIAKCERCYQCIDCNDCYNLNYSQNCENCSDSWFLYNCKNARKCFGSVNLVNKEYVFMNEQLSKEEYETRLSKLHLDQWYRTGEIKAFFQSHRLKYPHKFMIGAMNENVTGNVIYESRNAEACFDASQLEDCKYCSWFHQAKDCMDIHSWGMGAEKCYECLEVGDKSQNCAFVVTAINNQNTYYSFQNSNCEYLFGCVGMIRNKYCVFNKQYTKEEYNNLVPRIIQHMQKTGEWGQFFPMNLSPMRYNQTVAQDYFPINKDKAEQLGAKWKEEAPVIPPTEKVKLPDSINDAPSDICQKILTCESCRRAYKIIPQEFRFYREKGLPLPHHCFPCRHKERLKARNPRQLWNRKCDQCQTGIQTTYSPDSDERVYCEHCYLKNIY